MECEVRGGLLMLYAAGALQSEERRDLQGHLRTGCRTCMRRLAAASALIDDLPRARFDFRPPKEIRDRLMLRIRREPNGDP